jgi:uncharacterized membrane protein YhaH (DUF805 family)
MSDQWYVSRSGQRFGPVDFETLVESARSGRLEPRSDLVCGGPYSDWVMAGDVEGLFERRQTSEVKAPVMNDSMAATASYERRESPTKLDLPGVTRPAFVFGILLLPVILGLGLSFIIPQVQAVAGPEIGRFLPLLMILIPALVIAFTVKRFQNIGMSGWWLLGLLVPLLNYWLQYRLLACPPGYVYTKKLDGWGRFLAVLYWLVVIGGLVAAVLFGAAAWNEFQESGQFQEWLNQVEAYREEYGGLLNGEEK